jgi:hypothetical protein
LSTKVVVTEGSKVMYELFHFADATVSDGHVFCSSVIGTGDFVEYTSCQASVLTRPLSGHTLFLATNDRYTDV